MIARSYGHGKMLDVSKLFAKGDLPKNLHPLKATFADPARKSVVAQLKAVAQAFVDLQQARHEADYNLRKSFTRGEVNNLVRLAEVAFTDWNAIRKDDLARIYLACFLVLDDWNRQR